MMDEGKKAENDDSLFYNRRNRNNLFGVCLTWSMAGFCMYLLMYYSSQFAGNFYVNYSMMSLSNTVTIGWATLISKRFSIVRVI